MKKDKIINWSLLGLATLFVILYIVNKEQKLSYIYLIVGCVFCIAYAIFADLSIRNSKKERAKTEEKENKLFRTKINENKDLNPLTQVIYDIYNDNVVELNEIIKKTSCDIAYDYDAQDKTFYLQIDSILGTKKNEEYTLDLIANSEEHFFVTKDGEEDVSKLTYDELLAKVISLVKANVKISDKVDFVIKGPKWELILYISFAAVMLGGIVVAVIAKITSGFQTSAMLTIIFFCSVFILICGAGIYGYFKQELKLQNTVYTYRGFFKTQSCNAKDVKAVMVDTSTNSIKVIFMGKNNQVLIKYRDLGTTFKSGELKRSLNYYKIPLRVDYML